MKELLIVGNGGAAASAVTAIRSVDSDDQITLVSKEDCPAYSPVLATYYLAGEIRYEDMFICDNLFYQRNRVNTLFGSKVVKVDTELKQACTDNGDVLDYDELLIATGSSPIVPSIEGVDLSGVFTFYTAEDARRISSFLDGKESVAVIGAGLIGMQAFGALATQGKKVFLVEMSNQILPQILDRQGARILEERLLAESVSIHLGETVSAIRENDGKKSILLASGAELETDAVILAVGVRPNVDFLQISGIELGEGVRVDKHCRASAEGVYAAGDVAEAPDPVTGHYTVNATWPNAIEQGRVAGLNMAGQKDSILRNIRFNTFTVFGLPGVSVGLVRAEGVKLDEIVSHDGAVHRKLFIKDGLLVGAVLLGEIEDAGIIASLIQRCTLFPDFCEASPWPSVSAYSARQHYWSFLRSAPEVTT